MGNTYTNKVGSSFFEETSQKIWAELQGNPQTEQEYTSDFYGTDQNEKVDINKLVDFIKRVRSFNIQSFNWEHYISKATKSIYEDNYYNRRGFLSPDTRVLVNVNWIYSEGGYAPGNRVESKFNVKLNKRENDFIDREDWSVRKFFNDNTKKYEFILSFYFQETKKYRTNTIDDTFRIEEKYRAVQFKTDNLKDMFYLFKELEMSTKRLGEIVYDYIKEEKISEALAALYTQLPEELIVIMSNLDQEREFLKDHLEKLKKYDENSIFDDSSLAILNLFRIIKDIKYIYEMLKLYPETVLQLYYNMDGTSSFLGEEKSNKLFFAEMMQGIYLVNNLDALLNSDDSNINIVKEFKINDEYKIDSKISDNGDSGLIYLQQQQLINMKRGDDVVMPGIGITEITVTKNIGNASYLSPFDLITLERVENGKVTISKIPAIMLKAVVDQEVKAEMIQSIRVGITVAALIIGVATLGNASGPLAQTLALADIVLTAADLAILANEDQLLQTPEGKLFLETYNNVMLTASVLVAPFAIVGLAKMGLKLLKNAGQTTQKILRSCMLKIVIEKNIITFEKQATFLLAGELGLGDTNTRVFQRLQDHGVIYFKGVRSGDKTEKLFAVYDDVVLAEIPNNSNAVSDFAKRYNKLSEKELVEELEHVGGNGFGGSIVETTDATKIKVFEKGWKQFYNKTIAKPFEKIKEAMPYFNHKSVGEAVIQIGDKNCGNTVEVLVEFLRTGKLRSAEPSGMQGVEEVAMKCGGGSFQPSAIPRIKELIGENDIVIVYGIKEKNNITGSTIGHYFVGMKKGGELHLFDGQTGEYVVFAQTREYGNFIQRGYLEFRYTKIRK